VFFEKKLGTERRCSIFFVLSFLTYHYSYKFKE